MKLMIVLLLAATVAGAQPIELHTEVPVSAPEMGELGGHDWPHIASDGNGFLAVWTDRREAGRDVIYVSRMTADGTLLDPLGIRIATGFAGDIVWTGQRYLLLAATAGGTEVFSLDARANVVATYSLNAYTIRNFMQTELTTNGDTALVVSESGVAVRLDAYGKPLNAVTFVDDGAIGYSVGAASNGRDYLIAYLANNQIVARRLTAAGVLGEPAVVSSQTFYTNVAVASDGASYLVAWTAGGVYARTVNELGVPAGEQQTLHVTEGFAMLPRVSWRNGEYAVTFTLFLEVWETHLDASGEPLEAARAFAFGRTSDVATANDTAGFVWIERNAGVRAAVSRSRDGLGTPAVLTNGVVPQGAPQLARANSGVFVSWIEQKQLRLARLGGEPLIVAPLGGFVFHHELVSDGTWLWAVWFEKQQYFVRRYTHALEPVDAAPHAIAARSYVYEFRVAAGREGIAILAYSTDSHHPINATVLTATGSAIHATNLALADGTLVAAAEAIAWNGSAYVAAWVHMKEEPWWQFPQPVPEDILAVRITREGVLIDAVPIVVHEGVTPTYLRSLQAASANGGGVVLAWEDLETRTTFATLFRGEARPAVKTIRTKVTAEALQHLVPLPEGYLLVWTGYYDPALLQRVNERLEPVGEPGTFETPSGVARALSDIVSFGHALFAGYSRVIPEFPYAGVARAFVSHSATPSRRRSVR